MVSRFSQLCDELNSTLTPALRSAGYRGPNEEFSRHAVRYEFKRAGASGQETIAVLFNRDRTPQFAVQLYVEPPAGLHKLEARGGELIVGALSPLIRLGRLPCVRLASNRHYFRASWVNPRLRLLRQFNWRWP